MHRTADCSCCCFCCCSALFSATSVYFLKSTVSWKGPCLSGPVTRRTRASLSPGWNVSRTVSTPRTSSTPRCATRRLIWAKPRYRDYSQSDCVPSNCSDDFVRVPCSSVRDASVSFSCSMKKCWVTAPCWKPSLQKVPVSPRTLSPSWSSRTYRSATTQSKTMPW